MAASSLRPSFRGLAVLVAAAAALCSLPRPAHACGACYCWAAADSWVVPSFSRSVPLNLRLFVWLAGKDPSTLALSTAAGESVPFRLTPAGVDGAYWLEPLAALTPSTDYTLEVTQVVCPPWADAVAPWQVGSTFTTGAAEDHTPPQVGAVSVPAEDSRAGMCEASMGSSLQIDSLIDDSARGNGMIVQLDIETTAGSTRLFLPFSGFSQVEARDFGRTVTVTDGECFGYRAFDAAEEGVTYAATATVWDWSGNSTAISGVQFVATRADPGACGPTGPSAIATSSADAGPADLPESAEGLGQGTSFGGGCSVAPRALPLRGSALLAALLLGGVGALRLRARRRADRSSSGLGSGLRLGGDPMSMSVR
jgi:hypothetical protein